MSEGKLIVKNAKGVIFDLDGTLVDSMNLWKEIDVSYLGKHGYDVP
ncbi:MAG: HAD family phosphatase, partial [Lachnospiraceae bacterium]|nr:HAD family phosphatase [Lachnospiraceae bacterium]